MKSLKMIKFFLLLQFAILNYSALSCFRADTESARNETVWTSWTKETVILKNSGKNYEFHDDDGYLGLTYANAVMLKHLKELNLNGPPSDNTSLPQWSSLKSRYLISLQLAIDYNTKQRTQMTDERSKQALARHIADLIDLRNDLMNKSDLTVKDLKELVDAVHITKIGNRVYSLKGSKDSTIYPIKKTDSYPSLLSDSIAGYTPIEVLHGRIIKCGGQTPEFNASFVNARSGVPRGKNSATAN